MYAYAKNNAAATPLPTTDRRNVWNILIQVLIAALTALTGVFAGCQLATV